MKGKPLYGLSPEQLARLLHVSAKAAESADLMSEDQVRNALLRDYLSRRLSGDPPLKDALLAAWGRSDSGVQDLLDRSLQDVLLAPGDDPVLLRVIKDQGKRMSSQITSGPENQIGLAVYHAAIASALVHQGERITQHSYETLGRHFSALAGQAWMVGELQALFAQAAEGCQRRIYSEQD